MPKEDPTYGSHFSQWMANTKPKATLLQEVTFAQQIYRKSTTAECCCCPSDKTPDSIEADLRGKPLGDYNALSSSKGISADWLLDVFFQLPFCQELVSHGCELWFVRKVCINELLRRYDIHAGPLVDHVQAVQQLASQHHHLQKQVASFCDQHKWPIVQDQATVFVSYTGRFLLEQFVDLLKQLRGEYIWFDVLCVDQLAWTGRPDTLPVNDLRNRLIEDLPNHIQSIGRVVLFLERWDDIMHTLCQAWVLWEVFNAVQTAVDFTILMPEAERHKYLRSLHQGHEHVRNILADIDCQNAKSGDAKAQDMIVSRMAYAEYRRVNQVVIEQVRLWYHRIGQAHCETITTRDAINHLCFVHNLATLLYYHGRLDEANALYCQVVQVSQNKFGPEDEVTLHFRHSLACLRHVQGALDVANVLYSEVLKGQQQRLGHRHADTLRSMHSLAMLRCHQGRWNEAASLSTQALEGRQARLGPHHRDTLCTMHDLANVRHEQGRLEDAASLYEQALKGQRQVLGPQHPDTLCTVHNLAGVRYDQDKWDEAESLYVQALEGQQQQLGDQHLHTLRSLCNLEIVRQNLLRRNYGVEAAADERPAIAIGPPTPGNAPFHANRSVIPPYLNYRVKEAEEAVRGFRFAVGSSFRWFGSGDGNHLDPG
jgi:tetratricopeptide (TPR) repeat protein